MPHLGPTPDISPCRTMRVLAALCLLALPLLVLRPGRTCAEPLPQDASLPFPSEEALDLHCLQQAYPRIQGLREDAEGKRWLVLADGRDVLYAATPTPPSNLLGGLPADHVTDVRTSMQAHYPLEPLRPDLPPGFSPGRWRSYDLLAALYGANQAEVRQQLVAVFFLGKKVHVAAAIAPALEAVSAELTPIAAEDRQLRSLLQSDGGFVWRRVAGETYLSPHAFGIAIDVSPRLAAYWRWSRLRPHPQQQSYPQAIVAAFERQGFVWGGKWHEYDIMHFEYRPELICKARILRKQR